ncbi:MAG: hypothetical protein RIR26_1360 [Pseudomonadota bacterium]|jgi:hypothetical protein
MQLDKRVAHGQSAQLLLNSQSFVIPLDAELTYAFRLIHKIE